MIKKIRKFLQNNDFNLGPYEVFILLFLIIIVSGYVVYLKTATRDKVVYVLASIQRPDWWLSDTHVPRELLSSIKVGDVDNDGKLKVVQFKHFISEQKDWENYSSDRSIGRIQFEVKAASRAGKYLYNDQELLVGNPLLVVLGKTRMELLITDIQDRIITENYEKKRIQVKVYSKFIEEVRHVKDGMELRDNDGDVYAKVLGIKLEHSLITTVDQWGNPHQQRDPVKYDLYIELEILAKEENSRIIGYDDRIIGIGKAFIFSSPILDNVDGWIIEIY